MTEKVLVIDDDCDLAMLSLNWVRSVGYDGEIAHDGRSGLVLAESYRPDIILLDIVMPGFDGFEVRRRLQTNPNLAHIPVVFLSAKASDFAGSNALARDENFVLAKPYEGHDLILALASALTKNKYGI